MKIIRENLLEFERGGDPMKTLGLGGLLDKIKKWLSPFLFKSQYQVNKDYMVNIVKGDFINFQENIPQIPDYVRFNECQGSFIIDGKGLKDLFGCPKIVRGDFYVPNNEIQNLNGSPEFVGGNYAISGNPVKFTEKQVRDICHVEGKVIVW